MFVLPCSLTIPLVSRPIYVGTNRFASNLSTAYLKHFFPSFVPFHVSRVPLNFLCEEGGGEEEEGCVKRRCKVSIFEGEMGCSARYMLDLCSALGCCRVTTFHLENLGVSRDKRIIYAKVTATTPPILPSARKRRSSIEFSAT